MHHCRMSLDPKIPNVDDALKRLTERSAVRSQAARIRSWLPTIEQALEDGVALTQIHLELQRCGLKLTMNSFKQELHRARRGSQPVKKDSQDQRPALPDARPMPELPVVDAKPALPAIPVVASPTPAPTAALTPILNPVQAVAVDAPSAATSLIYSSATLGAHAAMRRLREQGVLPPAKTFKEG